MIRNGKSIVVNEHTDPDTHGISIFVNFGEDVRFDTGEKYECVEILGPLGIVQMTIHQWRTMLALGLSMSMQEVSSDEATRG